MPGGTTGVDLARAAHELRPALPVLLTSGYGGPALSSYGAEGEYELLAKPYTRAVLLERIGHMLGTVQTA
jgi:FixJ family two-component response regulator